MYPKSSSQAKLLVKKLENYPYFQSFIQLLDSKFGRPQRHVSTNGEL